MAQSAVCRWAVIHGWNSCSPHTAIWLFYPCSCLHHLLSPIPLQGEFSTWSKKSWLEAKQSHPEPLKGRRHQGNAERVRGSSECHLPWPVGTSRENWENACILTFLRFGSRLSQEGEIGESFLARLKHGCCEWFSYLIHILMDLFVQTQLYGRKCCPRWNKIGQLCSSIFYLLL